MASEALQVVIGLGANIGRPQVQLERAVLALAGVGLVEGVSGLYRSSAIGGPAQPDFLNAAVLVRTDRSLSDLLIALLAMERLAGRERRERWGPRPLDLDILWAQGMRLRSVRLEVPHPRLLERAFALLPLIEVAPHAVDPSSGTPYSDCISPSVVRQECRCVAGWVAGIWVPAVSGCSNRRGPLPGEALRG